MKPASLGEGVTGERHEHDRPEKSALDPKGTGVCIVRTGRSLQL